MMRPIAFIYFIGLLILNASCERKCTQGTIYLVFKGFDSVELSRVIVKKYQKGSGFVTSLGEQEYQQDSTFNARFEKSQMIMVLPHLDWTVELPLAGRNYQIKDIAYMGADDGEKTRIPGISGERDACQDGITYTVNDSAGMNPVGHSPYGGSNSITIKK